MRRILIDTDIGGDVDDALALALALNSPEQLEIAGITNVYLANAWRAGVTKRVLKVYGREEIPVCTGAEKPLIGWWDENRIPNSSPDYGEFRGEKLPHASDFIIRMAEQEDLTLVAIGPMTNIGLALAKAPHIASRLRIVMMGGQVTKAHPEWNIVCDPEAARIVFESGVPIHMIGLDVTNRCQFTREEVDEVKAAGNAHTELLGEMMEIFIKNFGYLPILHDPLAMATLLWEDLVTFEEKKILIETAGQYTRGLTVDCDWGDGVPVQVAVDVRVEEFKRRLIEKLRQ